MDNKTEALKASMNGVLKVKIEAMKIDDFVVVDGDGWGVLWDRLRNTAQVEEMTTKHVYEITKSLEPLARIMDIDTPLGVCEYLKCIRNSVFYRMWANSGAFAQYIGEKPVIDLLKKLRDSLITITKWWERCSDEIYIRCMNEPENKDLPSATDRCELENNYEVAREWLQIIGLAGIPVLGKPDGIEPMGHTLPAELDNERARRYFSRAVEAGLMSEQYKWTATKALLACFCREMNIKLNLGKGYNSEGQKRFSWKPFEQLFGIKAGALRASLNDIQRTGQNPTDIEKLNDIFKD